MENSSRTLKRTQPTLLPQNKSPKRKCGITRDHDVATKEEEDDDVAEVKRKLAALQRIVPGGESVENMDKLFEETAGYILTLQAQIKAMRLLTGLLEGLKKEEKKLGG